MAGFPFDLERFSDLDRFHRYWRDAAHEFVDPVLESKKRQLYSLVRTYLAQIAVNTWPTRDGRQAVPPEWETEQPERFIETVERLHTLAGGIVEAHQNLVRAARERLKV